ncbi:Penicillin-Binding Protein C-terminus Family [Thioflavicoccus mobilis 8321]|uniref:Penicillin-Binding Protein C-terminus Family n=1 Tax=Thioflavicoccus mobilis 8321 TaxID=765912 RepID=L0H2P5_9GAMM|nr:DUF4124 domain-containing protein [Thioflavicoccus mobilis]AGA92337.1 Penicillin-Binding Protein C-terminus Family [Thioflavicoccus mobilis 8321]
MIWTISFICVLISSPLLAADIYRWVDEEGHVTYSDRAAPGAEPVAASAPADAGSSPQASNEGPSSTASSLRSDAGPYQRFEIATPEDGAIVSAGDGQIDVGLLLIPGLMPEQRLRVLVDGMPVRGDEPSTQMRLDGLGLGTHQIRAEVLDAVGAVVARTATVSFHFRRPE